MATADTLTAERLARRLRISTDQMQMLADYCEAQTRTLMAEGMSEDAAVEAAATETVDLARSLGIKL